MAALQTIRSKGALLIGIIGLALFAFIAEEFFRSFETTSNLNRQQVGKVYGEALSVQDFQQEVEERSEIAKIQKSLQGQSNTLTDMEQEQVRETVWQEFVQSTIIQHEAEKLGLIVTKEDMQNALREGQSPSLQMLAQLGMANQQTGRFDYTVLQDFLKNYDKSIQQMVQAGQSQYVEQYAQIRKIWDYTEKQLRKEILSQKYGVLFSSTFISNPITAKIDFDNNNVRYTADVAAIPYSTIDEKEANVTDADMKEVYEQHKELFRNTGKTAALKILDITITPSDADRDKLMAEVQAAQERLQAGEDAAAVVGSSKTSVAYSNMPMSKNAFRQLPDVAAALDSMAVGSVKPAYFNAQDNTITTLKLIEKVQAADSVQYRMIAAVAATPEESATRADSILKALQGGANFGELAKKYGQNGDSVWMASSQYETAGIPEEEAKLLAQINTSEPGLRTLTNQQGSLVVQIIQRKNILPKYNVAIVKCPLTFSNETKNATLSKLNRFLADNRTLADIEKNAAKAGYILNDQPNYQQSNLGLQQQIGGTGAKDAIRWAFDEAKPGEVSKLYECGHNLDHLLVVGVKSIDDSKYLSLDDENVKTAIKQLALQKKKAAILAERAKSVKSLADARKMKGAVSEVLSDVVFVQSPAMQQIGTPEPKLAGAIARTAKGQFTGAVQGAAALYFAQVQNTAAGTEKFDAKAAMERSAGSTAQTAMRTLISALIEDADIQDNRYKF